MLSMSASAPRWLLAKVLVGPLGLALGVTVLVGSPAAAQPDLQSRPADPGAIQTQPSKSASIQTLPASISLREARARPRLKPGQRSRWVPSVKRALLNSGGNRKFGPALVKAVKRFQRQQALKPTGVVNVTVWRRLGPSAPVPYRWITLGAAKQRPVLRMGRSGAWVKELQRVLRVSPQSGYFGRTTKAAVRRFEASFRLPKDGQIRAAEWVRLGTRIKAPTAAPAPAPRPAPAPPATPDPARPTLRVGITSPWVTAVQAALGVEPRSGYFGPVTEAAVKAFQRGAGLTVDGVIDADDWSALGSKVTAPPADITQTDLARTSEAHRRTISVADFVASPTARQVVFRESRGQCDIRSSNGIYGGKWQMDADFWEYYGGLKYAPTPDQASCGQQDVVAHRGWIDRWWQPWPTAY